MSRFLAASLLSLCLMAAGVASVRAQAQDSAQMQKHVWSDQEDPHWRGYLKEHHRKYHEWNKASKREQREYWKWRDQHPDAQ